MCICVAFCKCVNTCNFLGFFRSKKGVPKTLTKTFKFDKIQILVTCMSGMEFSLSEYETESKLKEFASLMVTKKRNAKPFAKQ